MNSIKKNHRLGRIMSALNWTTMALLCCAFTANVSAQRQETTAQKTEPPQKAAQVSAKPETETGVETETSEALQVVSKRPFPFRGIIAKVDLEKKWIELKGKKTNRKMHVTTETRMIWHGEKALLSKAKVGERVGGSCLKLSDGSYRIVMVRFGPKDWENEIESSSEDSKNIPKKELTSSSKSEN